MTADNLSPEDRATFETYFRKYNGWTFARDEDGDYTEIAIELAFEAWTEQSRRIAELEQQVKDQTRARLMVDAELSRVSRASRPPITDADDIMNLQVHEVETIEDELPHPPPTPAYYCKNCRCANCGNTFAKNVAETAAPPNDRYELALRWLAESCDPKKLTGEFAVDHARRALEGSRIEPAAPPISTQCATHAIEYRIIKGIPCPWCVIDELKRNLDKAASPPKPDIMGARALWSMTCACECEGCKAVDEVLIALLQLQVETVDRQCIEKIGNISCGLPRGHAGQHCQHEWETLGLGSFQKCALCGTERKPPRETNNG